MMPHLAEECWTVLGQTGLVSEALWPQIEPDLLVEDSITLPVQVNGKVRARLTISAMATPAEVEAAALEVVQASLGGAAPKKVIVVPGRAVNIVA